MKNSKIIFKINIKKNLLLLCVLISQFLTPSIKSEEEFKKISEKELNNVPGIQYLENLPSDEYILGAGDTLRIFVNRESLPELTAIVRIDSEGTVTLKKLNRIFISGLTVNELIDILNKKYSEKLNFPNVEIEVVGYRPVRIYVDGEIENPGIYTFKGEYDPTRLGNAKDPSDINDDLSESNTTSYFPSLFDAIKNAGGITKYSDLSNIEVKRIESLSNGAGRKRAFINFLDVINGNNLKNNIRIKDGDIIKIAKTDMVLIEQLRKSVRSNLNPKFINVFISGKVNNPGTFEASKMSTLSDVIDLAGGLKTIRGGIYLTRYQLSGQIDRKRINLKISERGSKNNPYLKNRDIIYIGKSPLNNFNEILGETISPITNSLLLYKIFE